MGGGSWTTESFRTYSKSVGRTVSASGALSGEYSQQDMFKQRYLADELNPKNVMRECVDNAEHPATIPVILALDVTGSMGRAAVAVAKQLNIVMTKLYTQVKDVEFMIMGIGDLAYDHAPIQASQFESDIRIAEQLDKVYFENGGGGNGYESYSAAWYFGLHHTRLDCWNRGEKGVIITIGDEPLNPYLPRTKLANATGDSLEADVETGALYADAVKKFNIYHLNVEHGTSGRFHEDVHRTFGKYLDDEHLLDTSIDGIVDDIIKIIVSAVINSGDEPAVATETSGMPVFTW
jgi:hypothetical protein